MRSLLAGMLVGFALCADAAERPEDFAYGIALEPATAGPLRRVELPPAVYLGVTRADLGDVRVFNAQGEVVPHALMPRPASETSAGAAAVLPHFPIRTATGAPPEAIDIKVQRTASGTITRVEATRAAAGAILALTGYLIDASGFEAPIASLKLAFREPESGFTGTVRVEGSDDLARWSTLAAGAPVVALQFGGERLGRKLVELAAARRENRVVPWRGWPLCVLRSIRIRAGGGRGGAPLARSHSRESWRRPCSENQGG